MNMKLLPAPKIKLSFWCKWRGYFITGLFVSIPIFATLFFIIWIDGLLRKMWPEPWRDKYYISFLSLLVLFMIILFIGVLSKNLLGKQMIGLSERLLSNIPIIRWIYSTVKQVTEAFSTGKSAFKEVVLIRYPNPNTWAVAFVTSDAPDEFLSVTEEQLVAVFMPTTPNPTSGFLLFVQRKDIVKTELSVDQAFKLIISIGMIKEEEESNSGEAKNA